MNKTIENVLSNKEATAKDYFELINLFDCSSLMLQKDKQSPRPVLSMQINSFSKGFYGFNFSQEYTETHYAIKDSDIQSVEGKMLKDMDTFYITAKMVDGSYLDVFIYNTDTTTKETESKDCYDIDVLDLKERLGNYKPLLVKFKDAFGLSATIEISGIILKEVDDGSYILHITDCQFTFIDIPLKEDSCNGIFFKEGIDTSFLIKPYGQPFMEIEIVVYKSNENKPNLSVVK